MRPFLLTTSVDSNHSRLLANGSVFVVAGAIKRPKLDSSVYEKSRYGIFTSIITSDIMMRMVLCI